MTGGMNRKKKFTIGLVLASLIWTILIFGGVLSHCAQLETIVKTIPGYFLMVFGCFSLYSIGSDLWILKEFPEDHKKLLEEIQEAKEFFKKKGVKLN